MLSFGIVFSDEHGKPEPIQATIEVRQMTDQKISIDECFSTTPCGCTASVALRAYQGISFVPEKRAKQELDDTQADIVSLFDAMAHYITDETKEAAFEAFAYYVRQYRSKYNAYLYAKSRCVSWMITGRSGLDVNRCNKANDREERLHKLFFEWRGKAFHSLLKRIFGVYATSGIIMSDDPDALPLLRAKLERLERKQAEMKATNKAFSKYPKDKSLASFLEEQGITSDKVKKDIHYNLQWHGRPFPSYALTNNNARLKAVQDRIERMERYKATETKEVTWGAVRVVSNKELVRFQLFFPGKPDQETIKDLKSHGFRWSPSQGAWQRQDTNDAVYWGKRIAASYNERQTQQS